MVSVKPRIPVTWMSDDRSTQCTMCHSDFSMLNRRHHCRSCGSIFCHYCCYQYQSLPSYLPSTHKRYCDGKKHRVCNMCLREIIHVKKNKDIIMVFSLLRISLKQIVYLRTICKRWKLAIDTIIGVLKSLHLKIGYQRWTSIERRLISIHWKEFTGHSRLMVQAIRAMVGVSDITDMIRHYRTSKRTTNCTYLFCHAECTEDINVYDIMDLLSCFPSAQILDIQEMESWVGQIILKINNDVAAPTDSMAIATFQSTIKSIATADSKQPLAPNM